MRKTVRLWFFFFSDGKNFDLSFDDSDYFVDAIKLVLVVHIISLAKVSPPGIP